MAIARRWLARLDSRQRTDPLNAPAQQTPNPFGYVLAAALAVLTILVFAPVGHFEFVNYDDVAYVLGNPHVSSGLSADNVAWSLTAFENGNWHPLTLMSHMLDCSLFGIDPAGHHVVNLLFHVANVLLLFWLFAYTTSQLGPSAFVAALFAVHPLNIQTVAWVSERKSLLSTALWLLALLAHAHYRRAHVRKLHVWSLILAALAMAAKPMAVTLPLTLLLLDYWPLGVEPKGTGPVWRRYAKELAPFVALAAICGVLTLFAQRAASALQTTTSYPLFVRIGNALISYVWYLKTMIWPAGLAVFYPHPMTMQAIAEVAIAAVILAFSCVIGVAKRKTLPFLTFGGAWYAGTLLPVAGLIQVGSQAYADRYAYVPLIGIFVIVVWSAFKLTETRPAIWRQSLAGVGVAWIIVLALTTKAQLPYWHDSVSLFQRAIDVVPDNALAQNNLGMALVERNKFAEGRDHFKKAVEIAPWDTDALSNLGNAQRATGQPAEAQKSYSKALEQAPNDASIHYNLATALFDLKRNDEAIIQLTEAVRLNPNYKKARFLLGSLLYERGRIADARAQFQEVARIDPTDQRAAEALRTIDEEQAGK